jgi:TolB-like protein/DNA-binding winged helix-turn-helix (wHTH) protein/Tfp pilus assembly protein PilF
MDDVAPHFIYEFEGFELDPRRGVLRRRSDGQALTLTPKAFGTLLYLIEHAGELVEKDALFAAVWPNVVVEEGNLTQTIHVLRRTLGEHRDDHRFIVTVPGRGYRFVAEVTARPVDPDRLGAPSPPAPAKGAATAAAPAAPASWADQRWGRVKTLGAIAVALALVAAGLAVYRSRGPQHPATDAHPRSIAVLPFVDLSPGGDSAYFSDGLAEEVLNLLSQTPELRVIARTSSFSFRDRDADVATIARALGVRYLLEGSVRREGRRVRITAQLIEASSSSHLWSAVYERELDDVFAMQSEIAAAVAGALETRLASSARPANAPPADPRAHDEVLRGQFFYHRRGPGDLERALRSFERAVALDPNYARAWAGVAAIVYIETEDGRMPRATGLPRLLEAATRTVALDPRMAAGHYRLACYYSLVGEERLAEDHYRKALTLEPDSPLLLGVQAGWAAQQGRLDEAIDLQRRVVARDPVSAMAITNLGSILYAAGRLEEARVELTRANELSPGIDEGTLWQILVLQRKYDAALAFIERTAPGPDREQGLALVYHALGRTAEADAALARLTSLSVTEDPFQLAEVHAYRGEADESFRWLELAARPTDAESGLLPAARQMWQMQASPFLAPLHADPRWAKWAGGSG